MEDYKMVEVSWDILYIMKVFSGPDPYMPMSLYLPQTGAQWPCYG